MSGGGITSVEQQSIFDLLQSRAGLIFPDSRIGEVKGMMDRGAQTANLSLFDYAKQLSHDNAMFDELCNLVTIAETYFFRSPKQFDFVKNQIFPAWLKETMESQRVSPFHAWSAGCSTGEEAYSLAIMFDQAGFGIGAKVTATDICRRSLATAATAFYGPWSLRASDADFCNLHFDKSESGFTLRQKYTSRVKFAHLNLVDDISRFKNLGLENLDLIFCRNVLIYFDATAVSKVLNTMHSLLKPGGYLVLGPSDPAASQYGDFEVIVGEWGVFYRKPLTPTPKVVANSHPDSHVKPLKGHGHNSHTGHTNSGHSSHADPAKRQAARQHQAEINRLPKAAHGGKKSTSELLEEAERAYTNGQYEMAFSITGGMLDNTAATVLHIKSLTNFKGSAQAEKVLKKLLLQHPSSFDLHYLHGHLLIDLDLLDQALAALKRCIFLDSRAPMAHFTLAVVQVGLRDREGAQKSFRNVIDLCKSLPPDDLLPFGDGERVRSVTAAATAQLINLAQS